MTHQCMNQHNYYPRLFFTADTHFGQQRTLELSKRPFKNVEEMDKTLIGNWNSLIKPHDHVFHLGDFGMYSRVKELNGHIHLVFGNYERNDFHKSSTSKQSFISFLKNQGFYEVIDSSNYILKVVNGEDTELKLNLIHEPSKSIRNTELFNLFGHIHKLQMVKRYGLCVSSDAHHFFPISIKDVEYYIKAINNFYDDNVFE